MPGQKDIDVVIYGATGYTGQLVAEYMAQNYASAASPVWALAGRNRDKLAQVRDAVGAPAATPLVVADAGDPASLKAMAARARVVLTTVGPYTHYGEPLVAACVEAGTDYVDLCGEVLWMRRMIEAYDDKAKASGARIVFSCGFDSIPFDMGVYFLQQEAKARFGQVMPRIKGRMRAMQGTFSGGTAASGRATMEALEKDRSLFTTLISPFGLTPGHEGAEQPTGLEIAEDPAVGGWVAPFFMAPINTKNVHRSNYLMGAAYGADFVYDEMMVTGPGEQGRAMAEAIASANPMGGEGGPKPGEGPSKQEREAGFYDVLFVGEAPEGRSLRVGVTGDKDPGYGSTSKIITECALCLIEDVPTREGGILTPAPAFGDAIIKRLQERAGLTFTVEG
ncbi:MAG: saccharopine dehydrogenase family protein [Alphaproteobacteria bacterium]